MGPRGARARARRGQADPALRRLQRLPLVPCDGPRVVREREHRGADERALRQRQGRPGGAARRRRALHGCDRLDDGPGRLADDGLPHSCGRAVLRRHLLPARASARDAVLPAAPARGRGGMAGAARRHRGAGTAARRRGRTLRPDAAVNGAAHGGAARRGRARDRPHLRSRQRRLRPGAEVPARIDARVPVAPRLAGIDGDGVQDARRDGGWWHVRPGRRRLPPLFGRPAVARAALREDALRQRTPRGDLPARIRRDAGAAVSRDRRGDPRLHRAGAAVARGRPGLCAGRRHERRRGADLHVDGGGGSAGRAAAALRARALDHPRLTRSRVAGQASRRA